MIRQSPGEREREDLTLIESSQKRYFLGGHISFNARTHQALKEYFVYYYILHFY